MSRAAKHLSVSFRALTAAPPMNRQITSEETFISSKKATNKSSADKWRHKFAAAPSVDGAAAVSLY